MFIAEVYWDMEWELQQAGFDYTYDKRLYDRLRGRRRDAGARAPVADRAFQDHSLRFLENHDEPRAAATFPARDAQGRGGGGVHWRAGCASSTRVQLEGRKVHVSMHLGRRPAEPVDEELRASTGGCSRA